MNHEEWKAKLDTYLDGELPSAEAQELDAHLRECLACAAEALRRMQWKKAIKSAGERYINVGGNLPYAKRALHKEGWKSTRGWADWTIQPGRRWLAAAAALAAVLFVAGITTHRDRMRDARNNQLLSELVDLHVVTLASANQVDVVSSDRHTVKPWFAGKVPFAFDLPDLKDSPFELIGGRVSYLDQSPGAELLVRVRKHEISVFIFTAQSLPADLNLSGLVDAKSFQLESFEKNGLRYFVIGDVPAEDIHQLAERMKT